MKNKFLNFAFLIFTFTFVCSAAVHAMGGAPPEKEATKEEKPKYKLEILKMEVITSPSPSYEEKAKAASAKNVLMVIAPKDFQDEEFATPKELLEAKGMKVTVAAATTETAVGMYGAKVAPNIQLKDAKAADYDAVIFVGGNGASAYYENAHARLLAIEAQNKGKVLGAICIAPVILAKAGILEDKKATVSPFALNDFKAAGAKSTGSNVEVDGRIITAKGPGASDEFARAILEALQKK